MYTVIFIDVCQVSTQLHNFVQCVYSVCVDRDQLRPEQLELLLS